MLTKKFVKRSFTLKFYVKVWSCNHPFRSSIRTHKRTAFSLQVNPYYYLHSKIAVAELVSKIAVRYK